MKNSKKRYTLPIFAALGSGLTLLVMVLYFTQPVLLKQVELKIYDHFLSDLADNAPHPAPVILDIDEQSLQRFGQWPWARYRLALLIEKLLNAGAASVALDVVLAEPDRTSPVHMQRTMKEELGIDVAFPGLPEALLDNDALLGSILQGQPVVLGTYLRFVPQVMGTASVDKAGSAASVPSAPDRTVPAPNPSSSSVSTSGKALDKLSKLAKLTPKIVSVSKSGALPATSTVMTAQDITLPVDQLLQDTHIGFFNMGLDQDGLVRRVPLVVQLHNNMYTSLAVQAVALALRTKNVRITSGDNGLESLGIGKLVVPLTPEGTMLVPYRGKANTFPYISAADLLDGKVPDEDLQGKIVFIGTSAAGLLDIRSTPLDSFYPGVEVHANVADAILTGRAITIPPWTPGLQCVLLLLTGLGCTIVFAKVRPAYALLVMVALEALYFGGTQYAFGHGAFISPLWGMSQVLLLAMGIMALRFWWEERDKKMIRQVFSRYVSPEVVSRIVDRGEATLKGEGRELTIMFTDLRGFTSMSEKLSPEQVVSLLNRYFTPMTALVRNAGGTLDKFIGDAIMAFWNAPLDVDNHPHRAVTTALTMLDTLDAMNNELERDFGLRLNMGAGIHTGPAYVGNMGSLDLTSYTAIGDTVNLASRLEGLCSKYGFRTMLSDETAQRCGLPLQRIAVLRVKGRKEPVTIFTALSENDVIQRADELKRYNDTLFLYDEAIRERNTKQMEQARDCFSALASDYPLRLLYTEYAKTCTDMLQQNSDIWDGVWTLTSK